MPNSIVQSWPPNVWHKTVGTAGCWACSATYGTAMLGRPASQISDSVLQDYGAVMARQQAQQRSVQREPAGASADAGY